MVLYVVILIISSMTLTFTVVPWWTEEAIFRSITASVWIVASLTTWILVRVFGTGRTVETSRAHLC